MSNIFLNTKQCPRYVSTRRPSITTSYPWSIGEFLSQEIKMFLLITLPFSWQMLSPSDNLSIIENWFIVIFGLSLINSIIFSFVLFNLSDTLLDTLLDTTKEFTPILSNGIVTIILFFSIWIASLPYLPTILGTPLPERSLILSCKK